MDDPMKKLKARQGEVYAILNLVNLKEYIGQTVRGHLVRFSEHVNTAFVKKDKKPLYRAMRKYRLKNFVVMVLWHGPESKLNAAEKRFIRQRRTFIDTGWGYNLTTGGGVCKVSTATRKILSLAHRGIPLSPAHRTAVAESSRRPEVRAKNSAAGKARMSIPRNRQHLSKVMHVRYEEDPVIIEQIRASVNAAYASDETLRLRLSASQKVMQNRPEVSSKHSASKTGVPLSKAHKAAIGKSLKGHKRYVGFRHSLETRARMRAASKLRWSRQEEHDKKSASSKVQFASAEGRKKLSDATKAYWAGLSEAEKARATEKKMAGWTKESHANASKSHTESWARRKATCG